MNSFLMVYGSIIFTILLYLGFGFLCYKAIIKIIREIKKKD